jgi:hypothetical protein
MAVSSIDSQTTQPRQPGGQAATPGISGTSPTSPEETKDDYKPTGNRYFGALVLLAAIIPLPFLAALITLIVYLSPSSLPEVAFFQWLGSSNLVIILGLIITFVLWLLLAIPCRHFATAEGGRLSDYVSLQRDAGVLKKQLEVVKSEQATQDAAKAATPPVQYKAAIADIESNLKNYKNRLNRNGLPWVSYTGYVNMWDRINKVDEAMVGVLPYETVIESANYDELSLKDSVVPDSEDLLKLLNKAIDTLNSDSKGPKQSTEQNQDGDLQQSLAQAMLALLEDGIDSSGLLASTEKPLSHSHQQYLAQAMLALLKKTTNPPSLSAANNGQDSQQSEQKARADIRKVKTALHKFTNERWDGLVRARNQLMATAVLTAFFTYILVIIAILANIPRMNTIDAMVFYFLGAIVGLFGRLFDERNADKVVDDYGLSTTRIIVTSLISGLAVLVGILFVTTSSTIDTIYKITPQNLVFAAILGFAPNILISTLQSKSEEIKAQIKGASPSDQKSGKGSSGSSKGNSNVGSG